jgi:hypothetical protein
MCRCLSVLPCWVASNAGHPGEANTGDLMRMDRTQKGVAFGMALALLSTIVVFFLSVRFMPAALPRSYDTASRLGFASWSALVPCLMLMFCIARLAKHRCFTPDEIHGSGLTSGSVRAKYLQALLQNTLEQACLAIPVYAATGLSADSRISGLLRLRRNAPAPPRQSRSRLASSQNSASKPMRIPTSSFQWWFRSQCTSGSTYQNSHRFLLGHRAKIPAS